MRSKESCAGPNGKNATEKVFGKVLISSVCGMLLCMACLAGTTWAWFSVGIENQENVIQIADAPNVILQVDGQDFVSGEELPSGEHIVRIAHTSDGDDLRKKSTLYVTFIVDEVTYGCVILGGENADSANVTIIAEESCVFSWAVSWFEPGNAELLIGDAIRITVEQSADRTEVAAEATEAATQAAQQESIPTEAGS